MVITSIEVDDMPGKLILIAKNTSGKFEKLSFLCFI